MKVLRRLLFLLAALVPLASPVRAGPDEEDDAAAALLQPGPKGQPASPSDETIAGLLADKTRSLDPWLLAERLLERGRQDVAIRLAKQTDARIDGPLLAYVEAPDATAGGKDRAREYAAAFAANAAGDVEASFRHLDAVRAVPGRTSVLGALAAMWRGNWLLPSGRLVEGMEALLVAGEEAFKIGWWDGAATSFRHARDVAYEARSLDLLQRALEGSRALDEVRGEADALANDEHDMGQIAEQRGDLSAALRHYGEALSMYEALGKESDAADARSLRSRVLAEIGDFREAIDEQHALETYFAQRPRDAVWAENQARLGTVRNLLGDEAGASAALVSAIEAYRGLGDRSSEAYAQGNLGVAHTMAGRWNEGLEAYRAVLKLLEAEGDPLGVATVKSNLANTLRAGAQDDQLEAGLLAEPAAREARRAHAKAMLTDARKLAEEALLVAKDKGAAGLASGVELTLGEILVAEGRLDEALAVLEPVRDEASRLRSWSQQVGATVAIARARLLQKDWPGVLREARLAAESLSSALGSLGEADLARARALTPDVYDLGVSAAVRANRPDELFWFLEAGRAAALLRALGGRAAALRATVPEEMLGRLAAAGRAKVEAFSAWQKSRTGSLSVTRDLWARYEEARRAEQKVLDETQEAQTKAAGRLAPSRPVSIAGLRARLRTTARADLRQVFVLFNFQRTEAAALVVEDSGARVVSYPGDDLVALRVAFTTISASRDGVLDPGALAVVKRLLLEPLKIPAGAVRLFVCPDRDLAYLPLAAIVPDDWEVVWEPSATTYDLLAERRLRKGQAVLGLGDPDYHTARDPDALTTRGGPRLTPLPGTRIEVESITGRSEDRRLLAGEATERGLGLALEAGTAEHPWKSVHLACHGLVDVERPALSCLAITPGDGEDGFLTSSEVLRLPLRTDLTVLSACQTGRGKFVRGEGVMSLTRAFMFAGAPRVIVSLWDVEDQATSFLMQSFYREWNAGRGTAAALRLAQMAVRDREVEETTSEPGKPPQTHKVRPWADPKYWAAWVLWGLPD